MQEWFNWRTWKVRVFEKAPWVRIPFSPPASIRGGVREERTRINPVPEQFPRTQFEVRR